MRHLICFSCFLLCLLSYSQENLKDFLLVEKDSSSFYVFDKLGVHTSFFKNDTLNTTFSFFKETLPKTLQNTPFNSLSTAKAKGNVYFLVAGGGILYKYSDGRITRVDKSFAHRNQFSGHFFSFNNNLYLLGGYGYWAAKNYLTKFNFQSGTWEIVDTTGAPPKGGINKGSFLKTKNILYVFDFYKKDKGSNEDIYDNSLFELDLLNLKWTKKGALENKSRRKITEKIMSSEINYKNFLFQKFFNENFFTLTSPTENIVRTFSTENSLQNLGKQILFIGDNLVFSSKKADNTTSKIIFVNIKDFELLKTDIFELDDVFLFNRFLLFAGVFAFGLVLIFFGYFKYVKKTYYVNSFSIFDQNSSLQLNKQDLIIINGFKNREFAENNLILDLFANNSKSFDANVKRKNKAIADLNEKFEKTFKEKLILKKADKEDLRQVVYFFSPKINIVFQD